MFLSSIDTQTSEDEKTLNQRIISLHNSSRLLHFVDKMFGDERVSLVEMFIFACSPASFHSVVLKKMSFRFNVSTTIQHNGKSITRQSQTSYCKFIFNLFSYSRRKIDIVWMNSVVCYVALSCISL